MITPPRPRTRRWALTLTTTADEGHPTTVAVASYWTHRAACRALRRRSRIYPRSSYAVTPMDWAPYRHRAAIVASQLRPEPRSIRGLAERTAMTRACLEHTLLRMAREGRVTHETYEPNNPHRGVWKLHLPAVQP